MSIVTVFAKGEATRLEASNGKLLLDLFREAGLSFDAPCGGQGTCGKCRVELVKDSSTESVLSCQTRVSGDMTVILPESFGVDSSSNDTDVSLLKNSGSHSYGFACDLGTTTVVMSLWDTENRTRLGQITEVNCQTAYGSDVISRVKYITDNNGGNDEGLKELSSKIRKQVVSMAEKLLKACSSNKECAVSAGSYSVRLVISGNTIMQHIFAGIDPASIAVAPFIPKEYFLSVNMEISLAEQAVSLTCSEGCYKDYSESRSSGTMCEALPLQGAGISLMPCVSGYVGGDIVSGLTGSEISRKSEKALFIDIGTNGEMALGGADGFISCSVATGPAFEGAQISCGSIAKAGAVRHFALMNNCIACDVIGGGSPASICGSGLVDLTAELLKAEIISPSGRLLSPEDLDGEVSDGLLAFMEEDENENGIFYLDGERNVCLTAKDVRMLQTAKASLSAGISILLEEAGLEIKDVDRLYIAGSFGENLNLENTAAIGMIPEELVEKAVLIGNSSLKGAEMLLTGEAGFDRFLEIRNSVKYIELSGDSRFNDRFVEAMLFGDLEEF